MTAPISDIVPLTPAQAGLLLSTLTETAPGLYVVQMRFELSGHLDPDRLQQAWEALSRRHAMLRTAISWERTAQPVNVVMADAAPSVTFVDLRAVPGGTGVGALKKFLHEDRARGFELTRAPLSRVTVLRTGDATWHLVWTHHHIVLDGWSTARLSKELWQLYAGESPEPMRVEFAEYARRLADEALRRRDEDVRHWRERISDAGARTWLDRPRPGEPGVWTDCELPIDQSQLTSWEEGARAHGVTLATLYHAAWALALRGAGLGPDLLVFGTVADTRDTEGTDVVGLCVASVPLRVSFTSRPLCEWLRGIAVERAEGQDHARINLAEHRSWSTDRADQPFRYLLAVETYPHEGLTDAQPGAELVVTYLGVHESTEYALTAGVPVGSARLKLTIDTRRIAADDATALLGDWASSLDLLSAAPPQLSLDEALPLAPSTAAPPLLAERLATLADQHPDRPAVRAADGTLTFAQLNQWARRLTAILREGGVSSGERVGVLVDDSKWVLVSILGAASVADVVLLGPRHPAPYREAVLVAAGVSRVLTSAPDVRPEWGERFVLAVSRLAESEIVVGVGATPTTEPLLAARRASFLVYESGSAVRPTAQLYEQHTVVEAACELGALLGIEAGHEHVVTSPVTGLGAPWEMWVAPLRGGCTVLAPGAQYHPEELERVVSGTGETTMVVDPRAASALVARLGDSVRLLSMRHTTGGLTVHSAENDELGTISLNLVTSDPQATIAEVVLGLADVRGCEVSRDAEDGLVVAVSTSSGELRTQRLIGALRSSLPEGLVPRVVLSAGASGASLGSQRRIEAQVSALWAEVLGLSAVPVDKSFFDLGGHSLALFAVLRGLRGQGWTALTMTDLLTHATVRSLSQLLSRPEPVEETRRDDTAGVRRSASAARRERGRV